MALRYWVGGTGTWDASSTTNWSTASGGAGGASVPTSTDYVTINASSGGGTITLAQDVTVQGIDLRGFAGTFDFSTYVVNCAGNNTTSPRIDSTCTLAGTKTVNLTYSGATGTRTLGGYSTLVSNALNINVTAGTDIVDLSNVANYNNINFTGFSGSLTNRAMSVYGNLIISSGMTLTAGANAMTFAATSGTQQITTNGKTLDFPLTFNGVGGTFQLQDNLTTGSTRTVTLTNGTLDLNSKTLSCGLFSSSNSNTRSIAFGTGNITLTGSGATIWTTSTATGFSYTGTPTVNATYSGSTGTRTFACGGAAGQSETNSININVSAGSDIVAFGTNGGFGNIDLTGFSGSLASNTNFIYGNLTISAGMTITAGSGVLTFSSTSGTKTITTNGVTVDRPLTFNGVGGTWSFADALTQGSTRAFTITNGTVKLKAGATSTVGAFATSGSNQKYLQSTTAGSQATLSQASGTVSASYLTIQDINATGGATWQAFLTNGNVNSGNNAGWDWYYQPGEYMYTRRKLKRLLIQ